MGAVDQRSITHAMAAAAAAAAGGGGGGGGGAPGGGGGGLGGGGMGGGGPAAVALGGGGGGASVAAAAVAAGGEGGGGGGDGSQAADEPSVRALHKRYDALFAVRSKAVKGKGAWYWTHLEPLLLPHPDTGSPKAVKLRCCLCSAMFSASNPSRTASEHLKRGTCPHFNGNIPKAAQAGGAAAAGGGGGGGGGGGATVTTPKSFPAAAVPVNQNRKRPATAISPLSVVAASQQQPQQPQLSASGGGILVEPSSQQQQQQQRIPGTAAAAAAAGQQQQQQGQQQQQQHGRELVVVAAAAASGRPSPPPPQLLLSGGKSDLGALYELENNVKKLKSPGVKPGSAGPASKEQADEAMDTLADWLYESCGSVPFSSVEHPKFKKFLTKLGLPTVSRRFLQAEKLDSRYQEVKAECEAKLRDAMFFQLSTNGWGNQQQQQQQQQQHYHPWLLLQQQQAQQQQQQQQAQEALVQLSLNLPDGSSLFRRIMAAGPGVEVDEAVRVALEGEPTDRCVGVVSDAGNKQRRQAMKELEGRQAWMVNLVCQSHSFQALLKDMHKHLLLLRSVACDCIKLGLFFNANAAARALLVKLEKPRQPPLLLLPTTPAAASAADPLLLLLLLDHVAASAQALQLAAGDDHLKLSCGSDKEKLEVVALLGANRFWLDLEAALALLRILHDLLRDIACDRPIVSQCLPLWVDLRAKVKDWCARYDQDEAPLEQLIEKRFRKNYHPAWAAAFILDPLYLLRDTTGKYLPPFKFLTPEQERDVDRLITRLASRDEAHLALRELFKWRTNGLEPVIAQAMQIKERDPVTGRMKPVNPQSRRLVWETYLNEFKSLRKVACRLIFLQATSGDLKCNTSLWRWAFRGNNTSRLAMDKAEKMIFIAAQAKLERGDFSAGGAGAVAAAGAASAAGTGTCASASGGSSSPYYYDSYTKDSHMFSNGEDEGIPDESFFPSSSSTL